MAYRVPYINDEGLLPADLEARIFEGAAKMPNGGDDTASLNAQLVAAAGKTLTLKAGRTYKISDVLTIPSDTELNLNGATIDARSIPAATALGQRIAFASTGTRGPALPITMELVQGARAVPGVSSTATLSAGDLVLLRNEEQPVPGLTRTDRDKGELNVIKSVDSGTQISLSIGTLFAYSVNGLVIEKITPTKNVNMRNGNILMGGVGSAHNAIEFRYGRNITTENIFVDGAEDIAVNFRTVWNGKAIGGRISGSTSSTTLGNTGYGVCMAEGSRFCYVDEVEFRNCRHFVAGGGYWPASNSKVKNCFGVGSTNMAYDTHESCFEWEFTGNTASGCAGGFGMRGQYITVQDNHVYDSTGVAYMARTYDGVTEQRGIKFLRNEAVRCASGLEFEGMAIGGEPNCLKIDGEVTGNIFTDCGNAGTDATVIRHFDGMSVWGNTFTRSGRNSMYIRGLVGTPSKNLNTGSNRINHAGLSGMDIENVDGVNLTVDNIQSPVRHGINLTNCNDVSYMTPIIRKPGQAGVNITGGSGHAFTNPQIIGGTNAGYDAIRVSGSGHLSVVGGKLASARNAVYSTTTENVIVQGVNALGAASGLKISVDATVKSVGNNLV